jgi:2-keto-3-deoxy-L-rhamnonate aldolase RhmA
MLVAGGFQWAFLDTEHGGFDLETVQDICRVSVMAGLSPIVRVAELQYSLVARALDCGAQGIIFPRVEQPEILERAVSWTKFPPSGMRGYGLTAVQVDYEPLSFTDIIEHLNANTMVVMQIETRRALEAREELLAVPGIDAVMIGPADSFHFARRTGRVSTSQDGGSDGSGARQLHQARHRAGYPDTIGRASEILERAGDAVFGMQ